MYNTDKEEILKAQKGDKEALQEMVEKNNGLVWSIVKRFGTRGYELEDLYQIGVIGFIKSIRKFDFKFETKLSTYAVPYIVGEIKRFLRDDGAIKVSRNLKELNMKIRDLQRDYLIKQGREITLPEIAKELKITKEEIALAIDSAKPVESIYEELFQEDEAVTKIEKLASKIDEAEYIANKLTVQNLIKGLEVRDRQIILLRYYKGKTQNDVAKIMGISQVQISRLEKKILENMKLKMVS